jgi:transposase-like protein
MELSMSKTNTVSPLRERMIEDMVARKLNPRTQRSHIYSCQRFAAAATPARRCDYSRRCCPTRRACFRIEYRVANARSQKFANPRNLHCIPMATF